LICTEALCTIEIAIDKMTIKLERAKNNRQKLIFSNHICGSLSDSM
jgi:hypothetical protein